MQFEDKILSAQGSVLENQSGDFYLPTDSMQKSKLSSEASFLLDFSFPCKFTIFTNSQGKKSTKSSSKPVAEKDYRQLYI